MSKHFVFIQILFLGLLVVGCDHAAHEPVELVQFCDLKQSELTPCGHSLGNDSIGFYASDINMTEETDLVIEIKVDEDWQPNMSKITGHSMYMGEIPLVWTQKDSDTWQAEFSLPACTGHEMIWQMDMKINTHKGLEEFPIYFSSSSAHE